MKVAFATPPIFTIPPAKYGGEIFVYDLACGLDELGVETHIFGIPGSKPTPHGFLHYLPSCPLELFFYYEQTPIKWYKEMVKDPEFLWHDFTHSHIIHDYLHWHGRTNSVSTPWGAWIQRPWYKDNVVCWSQFHRELALQQGYPESTRYVLGGTNTDFFCPDPDDPYNKDEGYFLFMARMHPDKRPDIFLRLAEAFPNEKFVLSGSFGQATPDHAYYGKMYGDVARKLPNVEIIPDPSHEDKIWLLRHARALVHPSIRECFGLSIVEALSCGTPAIVSDDGAFPEIILQGKTGWLCRSFDDYVNAVKNADMFSPEECRRDAEKRWCRRRVAQDYLKVYEAVMKPACR